LPLIKKYGLNDEDLNIIKNNNYEDVINIIIYNKNNVCDVVDYLLSIGIEVLTLSQMFSDSLDLFMKSVDDIKGSFEKFNVDNLVTIINDDIANLKFI